MPWLRPLAVLALSLLLAGCSTIDLFNLLIPTSGFNKTAGLGYGGHPRQQLDVYTPKAAAGTTDRLRPVVVFYYGGSWESGSKEQYLFVAEALTSIGAIAVLPDYRIYPEVLFPDFIDDAALAFKWTKENAAKHGGDPERIFVMGHSAGAHLAAMLTFDERYLAKAGLANQSIKGMIGLAGPYDFLPLKSERLKIIFGPESGRARSQPINFVTGDEAPALLFHGDNDTVVGPHNSANLAQRITDKGGKAKLLRYPDLDHVAIVTAISAPFREGKPLLGQIADFVNGQR